MCKSVLSTTVIKNLESEKIFRRLTSGKHARLCAESHQEQLRSSMLNLHRVFYFENAALVSDFPPFPPALCKCAVVHLVEPKAAAVTASGPECNAATFIVFLDGCFILSRDILKLGQSMPGDIFKLRWPCTVAPTVHGQCL